MKRMAVPTLSAISIVVQRRWLRYAAGVLLSVIVVLVVRRRLIGLVSSLSGWSGSRSQQPSRRHCAGTNEISAIGVRHIHFSEMIMEGVFWGMLSWAITHHMNMAAPETRVESLTLDL